MKSRLSLWAVATAIGLSLGASAFAADVSTNAPAAPAKKKAKTGQPGVYPFHGTVASVDVKAATFTLQGKEKTRVIAIGSNSHLTKGGKPSTLADVTAGDYAHGRVEKKGGAEVVLSATFGPKPEPAKKKKTAQ